MRNLLVALFVVGLVAASSFGAINVQLLANATTTSTGNLTAGTGTADLVLDRGQTATVYAFFNNTVSGVGSIGGKVVATPLQGGNSTLAGSNFAFLNTFSGVPAQIDEDTGLEIPNTAIPPAAWTNDGNGGFGNIGSAQNNLIFNNSYAKSTPRALFSYTITAGQTAGKVKLDWSNVFPLVQSGWFTTGVTAGDVAMGTLSGLTVTVTPEPATMALLALGGLLVARRRHA